LAISAIEMTLTGQFSSDDMIIELMLEPAKVMTQDNKDKYDQKVMNARQKKIVEQKLDQIADLLSRGYKQREIAERLGLTQQTVSYRAGVIKTNYPELLRAEEEEILPNVYQNTKENVCEIPNVYQNTNNTKDTKNENVCKDLPNVYQKTKVTKENVCKDENVCKNGGVVEEPDWKKHFSF
jgi:predicted transcriptional regulator